MCASCLKLQRENAELRARLSPVWRDVYGLVAHGLTYTEARIVRRLYNADSAALAWDVVDDLSIASLNSLSVQVNRVRNKLGEGVIQTLPRIGYRLTDAGRARVAALLKPQTEIAA